MVRSVLTEHGARTVNDCLLALSDMGVEMGDQLLAGDRRRLIQLLDQYVATLPASDGTDSKATP
jgi:hypothetical protein